MHPIERAQAMLPPSIKALVDEDEAFRQLLREIILSDSDANVGTLLPSQEQMEAEAGLLLPLRLLPSFARSPYSVFVPYRAPTACPHKDPNLRQL